MAIKKKKKHMIIHILYLSAFLSEKYSTNSEPIRTFIFVIKLFPKNL